MSLSRMFNEKSRQTVRAPKWPDAVAVEHSNSASKSVVSLFDSLIFQDEVPLTSETALLVTQEPLG
jgi:hypothetical protein